MLSLVVPTHNDGESIRPVLTRLRHMCAELPMETEVIVADAGSADETKDIAANHGVDAHVLKTDVDGAIQYAEGQIVGIIPGDRLYNTDDLLLAYDRFNKDIHLDEVRIVSHIWDKYLRRPSACRFVRRAAYLDDAIDKVAYHRGSFDQLETTTELLTGVERATTSDPSVHVVMAARNEADILHRSIEGLKEQEMGVDSITFVDGGSTDGTVERFKELTADMDVETAIIVNTDGIISAKQEGCERAMEFADHAGDIILTNDADSRLAPNFVKLARRALVDADNTVFGAPSLSYRGGIADLLMDFSPLHMVESTAGRGMAFRVWDFKNVNGYKRYDGDTFEGWNWLEDRLLEEKLREHGEVVFDERTEIRSEFPPGTVSTWRGIRACIYYSLFGIPDY